MSAPTVEIAASSFGPTDLEMAEDAEIIEVDAPGLEDDYGHEANGNGAGSEVAEAAQADMGTRFLDFLKSPIIELAIGNEEETILSAHKAILEESPFFIEKLKSFPGTSADSSSPYRIHLPDEHLDAMGCFLQFQYTGEYFPRRLSPSSLEYDPTHPSPDTNGSSLLRHARVYTLAEKLSLPTLKALAHSKIHLVDSTAKGEIAYARYVYANTPSEDITIRKPVAAFWATRSHVLRHEAETEFRQMCLEFPQFGYDVLSLVLDQREKSKGSGLGHSQIEVEEPRSATKGRKRSRFL